MQHEALRPQPGMVNEADHEVSAETIGELIGFDFDDVLDDPDPITEVVADNVIIGGDLHVDGPINSKQLPQGKPGYTGQFEKHRVVVLGDLVVDGDLEIEQYFDLFVAGTVSAHSIRSCSANFVATGDVTVRDLVCTESSDEGGIFYTPRLHARAWFSIGSEFDDEPEYTGEFALGLDDEGRRRMHDAASVVAGERIDSTGLSLWGDLSRLIEAGHAARLTQAFLAREQPPAYAGPLSVVLELDGYRNAICGLHRRGDLMFAVGGLGRNLALRSRDGGQHFEELTIDVGTGLRSVLPVGDTLWVCGERGLLARSDDDGASWSKVDTEATLCLQTLLEADGALWATGDSGAFRSTDGGASWSKVDVEGEITRPQDSPLGVLLPSDRGWLYVCQDGELRKTALDLGRPVWAATCTPQGTVLATAGDGSVARSTDGGARSAWWPAATRHSRTSSPWTTAA